MSENKEKIIENGASNKDNKTKFLAIGAGFGRTGTMTHSCFRNTWFWSMLSYDKINRRPFTD